MRLSLLAVAAATAWSLPVSAQELALETCKAVLPARPVVFDDMSYDRLVGEENALFSENRWQTFESGGPTRDVAWYSTGDFRPYDSNVVDTASAIGLGGSLDMQASRGFNPSLQRKWAHRVHAGLFASEGTWVAAVDLGDFPRSRSRENAAYAKAFPEAKYSSVNITQAFWGISNSRIAYRFSKPEPVCDLVFDSKTEPGCGYKPHTYWTEINFEWNNYFADAPPAGPGGRADGYRDAPSCLADRVPMYLGRVLTPEAYRYHFCDYPYMSIGATIGGERNGGSPIGGGVSATSQLASPTDTEDPSPERWPTALTCEVRLLDGRSFDVEDTRWCNRAMRRRMTREPAGKVSPPLASTAEPERILMYQLSSDEVRWTMLATSLGVGHVVMTGASPVTSSVAQPIAAEFLVKATAATPDHTALEVPVNMAVDWYYFSPDPSLSIWEVVEDVRGLRCFGAGGGDPSLSRINTTGRSLAAPSSTRPHIQEARYNGETFGIVLRPLAKTSWYQTEWSFAHHDGAGWVWSPVVKKGAGFFTHEGTRERLSYRYFQGPGYEIDVPPDPSGPLRVKVIVNRLPDEYLQNCHRPGDGEGIPLNNAYCTEGENKPQDWVECLYEIALGAKSVEELACTSGTN